MPDCWLVTALKTIKMYACVSGCEDVCVCVCVSARYISLYRQMRCTDFAIEFIASSRA